MAEPGDDFGFELVDEPELVARRATPAGPSRPQLRRPRRPGRVGWLAAGVGLLIVVVVLAVTQSGGGDGGQAYRTYIARLARLASDSQAIGAQFSSLLSKSTLSEATLESQLSRLVQRQQRDSLRASALVAPPKLRVEHRQAVDAFQLRLSGLQGDLSTFRQAAQATTAAAVWPALLAAQADRLLASDVIWHDLVAMPTQVELARSGLGALTAPNSAFLTRPELATTQTMTTVLSALRGAKQGGSSQPALLKPGQSGPQIASWQRQLNRWLHTQPAQQPLVITGSFDAATSAATKALQQAKGLTTDGIVGPATRAALNKAVAASG